MIRRGLGNYYGTGKSDPEYYLSRMSRILFDEETVYEGKDYSGELFGG
jgi:hypothetical protein